MGIHNTEVSKKTIFIIKLIKSDEIIICYIIHSGTFLGGPEEAWFYSLYTVGTQQEYRKKIFYNKYIKISHITLET